MAENEEYTPTPDEMLTDEEKDAMKMMTPTQKELSRDRFDKAPLRELHDQTNPDFSKVSVEFQGKASERDGVTFTVKGHEIVMSEDAGGQHKRVSIDGVWLRDKSNSKAHELATQLWDRYYNQLHETRTAFQSPPEDIRKANQEVRVEGEKYAANPELGDALQAAEEILAE